MATKEKKVIYKVYDNSGTYLETWNDVVSEPSFSWNINGGMGEMRIKLARTISSYGEEADVALFNEVRVIVRDRDNNWQGTQIYNGWIASYAPIKNESEEYIEIVLFSYLSELQSFILKDGAGNTTVSYLSQDPSTILKSLITNYRKDSTKLKYTTASIDTTATTVSYTFKYKTYKECIDKNLELAPGFWYWYLNANNVLHFHKSDFDTTDHDLFVGQQLKSITVLKKAEDLYNVVYFSGGDQGGEDYLYKKYTRSGSITDYSTREKKLQDERVTVEGTADQVAGSFLDEHDHPEATVDIEVVDNNISNTDTASDEIQGYDIESIKPGDMIGIHDPRSSSAFTLWDRAVWDSDAWDFLLTKGLGLPMVVISIQYRYRSAMIKCSTRFPEVTKRIEDINRNLDEKTSENVPAVPTT